MDSPFAPRPGCPMCGIVSYASTSTAILTHSPRPARFTPSSSQARQKTKDKSKPDILYRDDNFTVYEEKEFAVSSNGHLVICFNLHVPSIYTLSSSDVPLLIQLQAVAERLLSYFTWTPEPSPGPSPGLLPQNNGPAIPASPTAPHPTLNTPLTSKKPSQELPIHIGFITPPLKDPKIPIGDHLHAHAYIGDLDRIKWYDVARKVVWNMGWWDIGDLIAEIREQTTNNRVKSGAPYNNRTTSPESPSSTNPQRRPRPITLVPSAGTREGLPNGVETTAPSLKVKDLETGEEGPSNFAPVIDPIVTTEWEDVSTPSTLRGGESRSMTTPLVSGRVGSDGTPSTPLDERPISVLRI